MVYTFDIDGLKLHMDCKCKMGDEKRLKLLEQIKEQGEIVRKLKAAKAEKDSVSISM